MAKTYKKRRRIRKSRRRVRRGGNEGKDVSTGISPKGFEETVKTLWGNMKL
jgi:hypothetical protein